MKSIAIKPHTIIMMVGPSGSGKSYFVNNSIIPALANLNANVQVLSTDTIRRELIGKPDMHRYHPRMMQVSKQAFEVLEIKLKALVSYPNSADIIIIDSTALNEKFRHNVRAIANAWNYNLQVIVFDYNDRSAYHKNSITIDPDEQYGTKQIIERQIKTLRQEALREINERNYGAVIKIKNSDFNDINIEPSEHHWNEKLRTTGDDDVEYVIIGDVHGCWEDLKNLLAELEFTIADNYDLIDNTNRNRRVIFIGDVIDKGHETPECVRFVEHNQNRNVILILGNHENFVWKKLAGKIADNSVPDEVLRFFDSYDIFSEDEDLKNTFNKMVENAVPFFRTTFMHVCHAPANIKYLGKLDNNSKRKQRSATHAFRMPNEDAEGHTKAIEASMSWFKDDADFSHPWHIFGHIALQEICQIKNQYIIDTGCVSGGKLTALIINGANRPFVKSISSSQIKKTEDLIPGLFKRKVEQHTAFDGFDLESLSIEDKKRINNMAANSVNFISGTMSPSDKRENTLESLDDAIEYFKTRSETERIILQKKYMGSRGNVYLFKDIEKSYAISRGGYKVKNLDFTSEFKRLHDKLSPEYFDNNVDMILIDCEIMPWRALGSGLIDESFLPVALGAISEIEFLKGNGFQGAIDSIRQLKLDKNWTEIRNNSSKAELRNILGDHAERTLRMFDELEPELRDLDAERANLDVFLNQLNLFGSDGVLTIKPFSILKTVNNDGSERVWSDQCSNIDIYHMIGEDDYCIYDINENITKIYDRKTGEFKESSGLDGVYEFWNIVTNVENCEGVVIKPDAVYEKGKLPYLKVRNPRYLTIVYGHDYLSDHKYQKLLTRKSIRSKSNLSIKEWEIGQQMLHEPYSGISEKTQSYCSKAAYMIAEVHREKSLDPRL